MPEFPRVSDEKQTLRLGLSGWLGPGLLAAMQNDYRPGFPAATRLQALGIVCDTWGLEPSVGDRVLRSRYKVEKDRLVVQLIPAGAPLEVKPWWRQLVDQIEKEVQDASN